MNDYPKVSPHSPLTEVLPDVFFVQGSLGFSVGFRFSRNMVVLREARELTLINAVRLSETELERLEALGNVKNVMRIGTMHGMDDAFYVDRYQASFWCQQGPGRYSEPLITDTLSAEAQLPVSGLRCIPFQSIKQPECVLLLERHGGLLITCDSIQDWSDYGQCTWLARRVMPLMGFKKRLLIGPIWKKLLTDDHVALQREFEAISQLPFRHLIAAHGGVRRDDAREHVAAAIRVAFAN